MKRVLPTLLLAVFMVVFARSGVGQETSTGCVTMQALLPGEPDRTVDLCVRFYDALEGGNPLGTPFWLKGVAVKGGMANVTVAAPSSVFSGSSDGQARYMGITVGEGHELAPRTLVTSVPYAYTAGRLFSTFGAIAGSDSAAQNPAFDVLTVAAPGVRPEEVENFRNKGKPAKFYRALGSNWQPSVGLGFYIGDNIACPAIWMYDYLDNQFEVDVVDTNEPVHAGRSVFTVKPNGELRGNWMTLTSAPEGTSQILTVRGPADQELLVVGSSGTTRVKELQITGADVAEAFAVMPSETFEAPKPGMVVSIDPERPGKLAVCSTAYDRKVAGAISGAGGLSTGVVMGERSADPLVAGDLPVAMSGRVYVLCDAQFGAIQPGDRLTTSSTAGHAMRVTDESRAPGAVIGKAMTGLSSGRGLVLVLVNLQ